MQNFPFCSEQRLYVIQDVTPTICVETVTGLIQLEIIHCCLNRRSHKSKEHMTYVSFIIETSAQNSFSLSPRENF